MKNSLILIAFLITMICLTGCTPKVAGVVIERDHDRGYWQPYTRTESYSCGTTVGYSSTTKSTTVRTKYCNRSVPDKRWIPDDWDITVKEDGTGETYEIEVSQMDYNRYLPGTRFDNTK